MATMARVLRGGKSTAYPVEFCEMLDDLKFAKASTEEICESLHDFCTDYLVVNGLNKYEKMSEGFSAYAARMPDKEASDCVSAAKPCFDTIARSYRTFATNVNEQVIAKLQYWLNNDYKVLNEEVRKLDKARNEFDNAADKYRRNPSDPEAETRKNAADAAHNAQIEATKKSLAALEDYYDMMADCLKNFDQLFLQVLADEKTELDKAIKANKF